MLESPCFCILRIILLVKGGYLYAPMPVLLENCQHQVIFPIQSPESVCSGPSWPSICPWRHGFVLLRINSNAKPLYVHA